MKINPFVAKITNAAIIALTKNGVIPKGYTGQLGGHYILRGKLYDIWPFTKKLSKPIYDKEMEGVNERKKSK